MIQQVVRERTVRLFEFLKAVRSLREAPVRDFRRYGDQHWWQADLPEHPGCALRTEEDESGAWLTVRQQQIAETPAPAADDPAYRVQQLYRALFLLRQRLAKEGDSIELLWGHGLLSWQVGEEQVWHPLLLTRVEIEFDPASGTLRILPGSSPTYLDLEPLDGLDVTDISAVTALAGQLVGEPVDPWDAGDCHRLYREIVNSLSPSGLASGAERPPAPGPHPAMGHAPVLFVRRRRTGYQRDLQRIAEAVRDGHPIPPTVASVVAYDQTDSESEWEQIGEELLLPLPTNLEQEEIARRLAAHHGVTVQGPPGTGKSHTIANLISHLLAHGKRVLVTSHAERPLQVLREKIPEAIRPLCVSLLGTDAQSLKVMEQSVQVMAEKLGALDQTGAQQEIEQLRQDLAETRGRVSRVRERLQSVSVREQEAYPLGDREVKPADLARWLSDTENDLGFIPDKLDPDAVLSLTTADLAQLYAHAAALDLADLQEVRTLRPDPAELPAGADLKRLTETVATSTQALAAAGASMRQWLPPAGLTAERLADLGNQIERAKEQVQRLQEPWLVAIRQDAARGGMRRQQWMDLLTDAKRRSGAIVTLGRTVAAHELALMEAIPLPEQAQALQELKAHVAGGGGLGTLALLFKSAGLKQVAAACHVDGAPVRTAADVDLLLAEVKRRQERQGLVTLWNQMVASIGGPRVEPLAGRPEVLVDEGAREIEAALTWEFEVWKPLWEVVAAMGLPVPDQATASALDDLQHTLTLAGHRLAQHESEVHLLDTRRLVEGGAADPLGSALWQRLAAALAAGDWAAWDGAFGEARRLQGLEAPAKELDQLRRQLAADAPLWAQQVVATRANPESCGTPARAEEAWAWRKAETWLHLLLAEDPNQIQRELDALLERERRLTTDLVATATWAAQAARVTDGQRRALVGWQQLIQRIGKGTGKYAPRLKREAQLRMQECREAVPVWIMPLQRVVENFDALGEPFDVVIADESSQCDTFALLALFRARRAVIVGDDNQISPQGVGVDEGQVNRLIDQYLEAIPNRELFGPRQSLYDMATRAFPGVIMLREHFRCLPEIIQFSNQLMYEGRILPLREPGSDPDWEPVIARQVQGKRNLETDTNEIEAEAVVEAVVGCCRNPAYKGKSMGVISLLGEAQARLIELKLLQRLGPKEMDQRAMLCGDAYYFQGDERDVIFLSLVESGGEHRKAVLNKQSDRQRFNVAASRARDQMWLFYSVDPAELHVEDVRSRLILYAEHPPGSARVARDPADLCESDLERAVLQELTARGYTVRPQVEVGHYRIDLVVEGQQGRLAVECDAGRPASPERWEADLQRQMTLERKGWTFFRLRGSAFYRNRERALSLLWERLEQI
jgi:very-short-patch-repair endonuclease